MEYHPSSSLFFLMGIPNPRSEGNTPIEFDFDRWLSFTNVPDTHSQPFYPLPLFLQGEPFQYISFHSFEYTQLLPASLSSWLLSPSIISPYATFIS